MESKSSQVEDQTDEDFFERLVDDEVNGAGSVPSIGEGDGSDEFEAFSNLSTNQMVAAAGVESCGEGWENGDVSASEDAFEDTLVSEEGNSLLLSSANESDDLRRGQDAMDKSSMSTGMSVKEVQWSLFDSESRLHGSSGLGSFSDFLNDFETIQGDPFASVANSDNMEVQPSTQVGVSENVVADLGPSSYGQQQQGQYNGFGMEQSVDGQDLSSIQYWENVYPGWTYDPNTGQWHQLEGYDANVDANAHTVGDGQVLDHSSDVYNLQKSAQPVVGTVTEGCTTGSVSNWNQISLGSTEYPANMVFDPQYPGWYYDTVAQEWRLLESPSANQLANVDHNELYKNDNFESYGKQGQGIQDDHVNWDGCSSNHNQQITNMSQTQSVAESETVGFSENQQFGNFHGSTGHLNNLIDKPMVFKPSDPGAFRRQASRSFDASDVFAQHHYQKMMDPSQHMQSSPRVEPSEPVSIRRQASRSFDASDFFAQHNQKMMEPSQHMHFSPDHLNNQKSVTFSQPSYLSGTQISYASSEKRSSAGRPPHALVTFGFGGKLLVIKCKNSFHTNSAYQNQDSVGGVVNVLHLIDVVMEKEDASSFGLDACNYFRNLCHQSFPGPLVGGNVGNRELNKWVDDMIVKCESPYADYKKVEVLRLLFSLLKLACQYYGKFRSPFGTDQALKESDHPESAVAKLFVSVKRNNMQSGEYGALRSCLQNMPSEGQIQATALEVQKLLVSGRKQEALACAHEGQLWGPALVLASQLGDQFYGDTVKQMALKQLVAGSPLRTLCLLIAGQPADVFSNATSTINLPVSVNMSQQPSQIGSNCMLDEWKENLAVITANRTKDDELVLIHLGDCLWKERAEIIAAHICYLVAEANFESYSDTARLCLIGADHLKYPRTYANPEAIQRTELYEYAKVLGNSQCLLLTFQPYKLIYAHMLAEVGKLTDSLKYCQAILKSVKTGRSPEVGTLKQLVSSLEERIKTHQQGGYSTNLAPNKLVGKLLTLFDSTAHRVVGGLPPPVPTSSSHSVHHNDHAQQPGVSRVPNSQSTTAMSLLMPSSSMEPISEWTGESNRLTASNRSISEPDFGKTPRKVDTSKDSSDTPQKSPSSGGSSRFGRFGSKLFQKTVGLVLRSRPDRQAKLGEKNKFYYDEKLKRWVEEGAESPAEEAALQPPPTNAAFQSRLSDSGAGRESTIASERSSGVPPIPPSSNQSSARGRMGVRSRYVDTFNKGGGTPVKSFHSPSIPASKPRGGPDPNFFIPVPTAAGEEKLKTSGESMQEAIMTRESPTSSKEDSFASSQFSTKSPMTLQRVPSMDNIVHKRTVPVTSGISVPHHSRAASWSGTFSDAYSPTMNEIKPLGEALGMPPSLYIPTEPTSTQISNDLHEVAL